MTTQAEFNNWMEAWHLSRLDASDYDPAPGSANEMSAVKRAVAVAAWHQILGRNTGEGDTTLINMHTVMGEIYYTLKSGILDKILIASLEDNADIDEEALANQIGRASCRERVCQYV